MCNCLIILSYFYFFVVNPADGYIRITSNITASNGYVKLFCICCASISGGVVNSGYPTSIAIAKGQGVTIFYDNANITSFRFYYTNGIPSA